MPRVFSLTMSKPSRSDGRRRDMTRIGAAKVTMALLVAPGLLAACGGSSGKTSLGTTASPPPATSTTTASPSDTASGNGATASCATSDLKVSLGQSGAAAGTFYQRVEFRNAGTEDCTLTGYPGVSFADDSGHQVGASASRNPANASATVTLAPGSTAYANLGIPNYGNFPAANCAAANATMLRVYPPNQRDSVMVPDAQKICTTTDGRPTITAVQLSA